MTCGLVRAGCGQEFERGAVYSSPGTGTHVVRGAILARWRELGTQAGPLGYPVADEEVAPGGGGALSRFEYGAVYWSAETGARMVRELYGRTTRRRAVRRRWGFRSLTTAGRPTDRRPRAAAAGRDLLVADHGCTDGRGGDPEPVDRPGRAGRIPAVPGVRRGVWSSRGGCYQTFRAGPSGRRARARASVARRDRGAPMAQQRWAHRTAIWATPMARRGVRPARRRLLPGLPGRRRSTGRRPPGPHSVAGRASAGGWGRSAGRPAGWATRITDGRGLRSDAVAAAYQAFQGGTIYWSPASGATAGRWGRSRPVGRSGCAGRLPGLSDDGRGVRSARVAAAPRASRARRSTGRRPRARIP